ncbi:hypothetical protein [Dasania marina]|uniref:hypothetical protein n=1 Tax=Dasania marina TaxID=471499 RepID=UPI0004B7A985|nr:hypothetical protein [Dasania marina]
MQRMQLFEFTDIPWLPPSLRSLVTDFLHTLIELNHPFLSKITIMAQAVLATDRCRVIDLCSGSSGPWLHLTEQLRSEIGQPIEVLLTDKFPDQMTSKKVISTEDLACHPDPVDVLAMHEELKGARSLFNALHHFEPEIAQIIIADVVKNNQAIIMFELLQRTWYAVLLALTTPFAVMLLTPLIRPFSFRRLFFTYVIPIAPIMITWDGLVSELRCYTTDELQAMSQCPGSEHYQWHIGAYKHRAMPVTYMVAYPKQTTCH